MNDEQVNGIEEGKWQLKGEYKVVVRDQMGEIIAVREGHNDITNVGLDHILDSGFNAATQVASWYILLVDNSGFSAFANTDTMASHAGWTEVTGYSEANRVEWAPDAPSSQVITNAVAASFSINATNTVKGIGVTSNSTKSGTTGTLWSTAPFALPVAVVSGNTLDITYTVTASRA